ncbi:unnamed protein product [Closterium sp. Yama58-4]|nr:unnamed protein product [Closterium sp. Yama58-4]
MMATLSGPFPTSQCQWMKDLTDSVIIHVDGDGRSTLLMENMFAEQQDSACQDSERTSSRANESSAADKQPSQWRDPSRGNDPGAWYEEQHIGGAASHERQREEPSESNSNNANREKMRRNRLNDRFEELARSLERSELARADRGSILVDAVRVLAQLRAERAQLRGSAEHMREQIRELKAEKSELREERACLLASKQQLEDEVRRLAASGAAQSTAATSAAASVVSSAARPAAAVSPPLGFAPCAPGSPGSPGAVPLMLHAVCEPGKLGPMGAPMGGDASAPTDEFRGADGRVYHSHDGLAPHSHEPLDSAGSFALRAPPLANRDLGERAFTVGIGGPVGSGKTALMLALCRTLRDKYSLAAVTNDIFTQEDGEFLIKHAALSPPGRIRAVETGGCPHAAIREDISINLGPLEELSTEFKADMLLCESGGDNLAANFSRELADYIIYIIDVSGGDKIPRKGGPGITQADLLVVNKTDLAPAIGADLAVMEADALRMRDGGPLVFAQVKHGVGVPAIVDHVLTAWSAATGQPRR